jgi:hypothetical protein
MSDTGKVGVLGVHRCAPLDAAERTALGRAVLPEDVALAIGIDRPADSRLLADDDHILAAGQRRQRRRRAEVEVVAGVRIEAIAAAFSARENILGGHLV